MKTIIFKKANKKWHIIACDTININQDTLVNADCNFNFYVDPANNNVDIREYSDDEIRLLYVLEPYGVADYVKRYAEYDKEGGLERWLFHKDRFFEILFGRKPAYFKRSSSGTWEETTDLSDLEAVLSESELIFGTHQIRDKFTNQEIYEKLEDIYYDLLFDMLGISTIVEVAQCAYGLFILGDASDMQSYLFSNAVDEMIGAIDAGWLGLFLNLQNDLDDINDIIQKTVADTEYFGEIVQYRYTDTVFVLSVELDSGDVYEMNEIYEKYESLIED